MKKVLIGVIIAAVVAVGGVAIYTNSSSSSKASSSASPNATMSSVVIASTNNNDKTKSDATAKVDATKQQTNNAAVASKVATTQTTDAKKASVTSTTGAAAPATSVDTTKTSNDLKSATSSASIAANPKASTATSAEHTPDTVAKTTRKFDSSKAMTATTTVAVGPNQINQGTGNFSGISSYPFMVATLSNGQQIIIPIKNTQKEGNLLVTNGYYTNNIHTPVQFKISSLGNGAYNFYQMQGGSILSDLSVVSQGGSLFTGNNIDTIGNDEESVGIQGIYQGSESDGYYPGSMIYHPFYNGTVNGENVTFANLGNNNYLEYRAGKSTPYRITVTWNPFPNVNIQLDESLNGSSIGKFDITSFAYGSNTYSGDYFHYIGHTKAGVESRFSISGAYSPN